MSAIRNLVDELRKMYLIKEPGQDVKKFGSQVIDQNCRIVGSRSAPNDIASIFAQCSVKYNVLVFKLKDLQFYGIIDDDPTIMDWGAIIWKLKVKYRSIYSHNLWITKAINPKANSNTLAGLHAKVNKLTAQVGAKASRGAGNKCWTYGGDHVQADCPRKSPE